MKDILKLRKRRVLVDIDTQYDFFTAQGKHCIRNHRRVLKNVRRLSAWARLHHIKVISSLQSYSPGKGCEYCVEGSHGYSKISYTIRNRHLLFEADGRTDLPRDMMQNYDQIILMKRCLNPFEEPRAERILTEINADEFIVIGANADGAVRSTVLGLLQRGKKVTVVTDAIGYQSPELGEIAFRKMQTKGARLIETKQIAGQSHLENVSACGCERCSGKMRKNDVKIGAA